MKSRGLLILAALAVMASAAELRTYKVDLPARADAPRGGKPSFAIRGMKGWAWLPAQYLAEIPVMAKYRMNFLMNCYSSLWDLGPRGTWEKRAMNHWHQPMPEARKREWERIVTACKRHRIDFCFSMNPNLWSDRAFDYESNADFEALWQHYAWMQSLGVKWFNISLDDISQRIDGDGQARLLNRMLARLREKDKDAKLIFCPTWYAGPSASMNESIHRLGAGDTPGNRYTRAFAAKLDPDIYLFWTGPDVSSITIQRADAEAYRALVRHKIILWDNYPVNDQNPALHLAALTGRDPQLAEVLDGYIGNPMSFQNESNRIPMFTIASFLWNARDYDPARAIGQAIVQLEKGNAQRETLRDLVQLYPGRLWDASASTAWNSLRERQRRLPKADAEKLRQTAADVLARMKRLFPNRYLAEREVLAADLAAMAPR